MSELADIITSNFLLVNVTVRQKAFRKIDRSATAQTLANNGAVDDAGDFQKNLFAGAKAELDALRKAGAKVRTMSYENTIPFCRGGVSLQTGDRMLPVAKSLDFMAKYNALEADFNAKRADFELVYEDRRDEALANLGGMANPLDYPDVSEIAGYFQVSLDMKPVPHAANLPALPGDMLEEITAGMVQSQVDCMENALADTRRRLGEELTRVTTQLGKAANGEKTRLFKSLLGNMEVVVGLLEACNINNDPVLSEVCDGVRNEILHQGKVDIEDYKNSVSLSTDAAEAAARLGKQLETGERQAAPSPAAPEPEPAPLPDLAAAIETATALDVPEEDDIFF